jgi:hypothetical protein
MGHWISPIADIFRQRFSVLNVRLGSKPDMTLLPSVSHALPLADSAKCGLAGKVSDEQYRK